MKRIEKTCDGFSVTTLQGATHLDITTFLMALLGIFGISSLGLLTFLGLFRTIFFGVVALWLGGAVFICLHICAESGDRIRNTLLGLAGTYWMIFGDRKAYVFAVKNEISLWGMGWIGFRHGVNYAVLRKSVDAANRLI